MLSFMITIKTYQSRNAFIQSQVIPVVKFLLDSIVYISNVDQLNRVLPIITLCTN